LLFPFIGTTICGRKTQKAGIAMNDEPQENPLSLWESSHPWLVPSADREEDPVEEEIRYALDEIRFA